MVSEQGWQTIISEFDFLLATHIFVSVQSLALINACYFLYIKEELWGGNK